MKFCKNCNQLYKEESIFCPKCGEKLESTRRYDIFGDPMDDVPYEEPKGAYSENVGRPTSQSGDIKRKDGKSVLDTLSEILSLLSTVLWLLPFYGTIVSVASLVLNIINRKVNNKKSIWMVLSIIAIALSIIWIIVLIASGVFKDVFGSYVEGIEEYFKESSNM